MYPENKPGYPDCGIDKGILELNLTLNTSPFQVELLVIKVGTNSEV